jgi:hypothetical protein
MLSVIARQHYRGRALSTPSQRLQLIYVISGNTDFAGPVISVLPKCLASHLSAAHSCVPLSHGRETLTISQQS